MAAYISFQPSDFYNTKIYTGTGSSNAVTGVGFQPDFLWIKERDGVFNQIECDAVRGAPTYNKVNTNAAEVTDATHVASFDSDGFTVGTDNNTNSNTNLYVAWNWKAGTTTGIAGSPSITPTNYSFNATSGFSIIEYVGNATSGATLPHGLGTADIGMIIVKRSDGTSSWQVYNKSLGATKYLQLDTTDTVGTSATRWNDTEPTSTLFSLGNNSDVNGNTDTYISYVFAEKKGYSKMGTYVGNNNADGPFIYTGFRPGVIIIKDTSAGNNWAMFDDKRLGYNPDNNTLFPNTTDAETTNDQMDLLSNGFKCKIAHSGINGSGSTYAYAAFAEFPFVSSNSKAGVAR